MVGTSEQESVFNIEAKLQISPITPCSFVLKVGWIYSDIFLLFRGDVGGLLNNFMITEIQTI